MVESKSENGNGEGGIWRDGIKRTISGMSMTIAVEGHKGRPCGLEMGFGPKA